MSQLHEALEALVVVATAAGVPAARARQEGLAFAAAIAEAAPRAAQDWAQARDGSPVELADANAAFFDAASTGRRWRQSPTAVLADLAVTDRPAAAAYAKALTEVAAAACTLGEPTIRVTGNASVAAAAQLQAADLRPPGPLLPGIGRAKAPGALPTPPALDPRTLDVDLPGLLSGLPLGADTPAGAGIPPGAHPPASAAPPASADPALGPDPTGAPADPATRHTGSAAATAADPAPAPEPVKSLQEQLADLDAMVGLARVKREVHQQVALLKVDQRRREAGMRSPDITRHLVFVGNPGTGKTTVARMVGGIYRALGLLPKGQLVEVDRSELVAGYLGQTAIKTSEVCAKAYGGVLFVDEAYSLSGDQYGQEAINTLVKEMEDHREDLVVIVAGYPDPMVVFIAQNPGLASRFKTTIEFEDYTDEEIVAILDKLAAASDYDVTEAARTRFRTLLQATPRGPAFGNGRFARNLLEEAIGRHAWRLQDVADPTLVQLRELIAEDFEPGTEGYAADPPGTPSPAGAPPPPREPQDQDGASIQGGAGPTAGSPAHAVPAAAPPDAAPAVDPTRSGATE